MEDHCTNESKCLKCHEKNPMYPEHVLCTRQRDREREREGERERERERDARKIVESYMKINIYESVICLQTV